MGSYGGVFYSPFKMLFNTVRFHIMTLKNACCLLVLERCWKDTNVRNVY